MIVPITMMQRVHNAYLGIHAHLVGGKLDLFVTSKPDITHKKTESTLEGHWLGELSLGFIEFLLAIISIRCNFLMVYLHDVYLDFFAFYGVVETRSTA